MKKYSIVIIFCFILFNISLSLAQEEDIFQILTVPADGTPVWTKSLEDFYYVCFEVKGTYQYWYPAHPEAIADARYAETTATGTPGWTNPPDNNLDLFINDQPANFFFGAFNKHHSYKGHIGSSGKLKLQIKDDYYGDNRGELTFILYGDGNCAQTTKLIDFKDDQPFPQNELKHGEKVAISWYSPISGNLEIFLHKGGQQIYKIGETSALLEKYDWTVPDNLQPGEDYWISIEILLDIDEGIRDYAYAKSDFFSIEDASPPPPDYFHEFDVPADGTKMWSRSLKSGKYYRITSSGTYKWQEGWSWADAEFAYPHSIGIPGWVNLRDSRFELLIDERDNLWSGNTNDHEMQIIRKGHSAPLNFNIHDNYYDDNKGELHITIKELSESEVPNFISILKPQGFHSFKPGEEFRFQWDSNLTGDVQISLDNGYIVKSSTENDGVERWTIPYSFNGGGFRKAHIKSLSKPNVTGTSEYFLIDIPEGTIIDRFDVPANGIKIKSKPLAPGQKYKIKVKGYYHYWWPENSFAIADAEYILVPIEQAHSYAWQQAENSNLDLLVNGKDIKWSNENGEPDRTYHEYEYKFTGTGEPASFQIKDDYYGDNKGELQITIETDESALPVELITFDYTLAADNKVQLKWMTASETNNYGFEIQHKAHNTHFEKVGFVEGHGTTAAPKHYQFTDSEPALAGVSYRLKQLDTDGAFEFSETLNISLNIPTRFELLQNYPNPFNASTVLKYKLPESAHVKLAIYNLKGQEITTLINRNHDHGEHGITWNGHTNYGTDAASGIYFYKLIIDNQIFDTKKLALLR